MNIDIRFYMLPYMSSQPTYEELKPSDAAVAEITLTGFSAYL